MSLPLSPHAYTREYELLDRAVDEPKGLRISFESYDAAASFRSRVHYARKLEQKKNMEVYAIGDPLYGTSPYDGLVCRIRTEPGGKVWLRIEHSILPEGVESL